MADEETTTPYSTTTRFVEATKPTWLNDYDAARLAAYEFYDNLYRNDPDEYKLILRGTEEYPIYIPSAKRIINVLKRYVGRKLGYKIGNVEGTAFETVASVIGDLFRRERIVTQFNSAKKQTLVLGDGILYITADPEKAQGSRLRIISIDPATYFPISDENDPDRLAGAAIVERILSLDGDTVTLKRQRYLKYNHPDHPTGNYGDPIAYESIIMDEEDWEDPDKAKTIEVLTSMTLLPKGIDSLPLYHFKCGEDTTNPFGVSILAGLERIMLALNQTMTDEDVAVSMAGLGMYHSDSRPVDEQGNDADWIIGPNRVVETAKGGVFDRIQGISSLSVSQDHVDKLMEFMESTLGISSVALGQIDSATAESGIALSIKLAPLLDAADEQNQILLDVLYQFFFDLKKWLKAYEGIDLGEALVEPVFENPVPRNLKEESDRLQDLFVNGIISKKFYREQLSDLFGYSFPESMDQDIIDEQLAMNPYSEPSTEDDETDQQGEEVV